MNIFSPFSRRAWEKYPTYYTDEEHDNLDDDPNDPRNTSKTLAEELAACEEKERAATGLSRPRLTSSTYSGLAIDPEKRVKARIGKGFLRRVNLAKAVNWQSYSKENQGTGNGTVGNDKTPAGIYQDATNGELQSSFGFGASIQAGKSVSPETKRQKECSNIAVEDSLDRQ